MKRRIAVATPSIVRIAAICLVAAVAHAESGRAEDDAARTPDEDAAHAGEIDVLEANVQDAPPELDALSRRTDDAFPDVEAASKRKPVSVTVRALDKVTAKYTDIEIPMGEVAAFGTLDIKAQYCDQRPPEEFPETTAFLQISERSRGVSAETAAKAAAAIAGEGGASAVDGAADSERRVFSGWMFASSPALNPLEHPVYDVWVIDCKTVVEES
ncbi:MAG: DUF2155 domain-containing protein [Parvularculaceae bacterium]